MSTRKSMNRRDFLKTSVAASAGVSLFTIIPASAMGRGGKIAPSNRITLGCVGVGGQGNSNLDAFLNEQDCQVIAVCDVDKNHLRDTKGKVDRRYRNTDCSPYADFRELIARKDIDAISLCTPDHWHAVPAVLAASSGKDIFGEKPISHCLAEGRAMSDAVSKHSRIWQTGSWQRSVENFRMGCELVRNGRIGKIVKVEVGLPTGSPCGPVEFKDAPPELDYNFWVGPSRMMPYCDMRTHWNWRWQLDFGGGQMMDWIGHHLDIAHWGMDTDNTGPIEIEGQGNYPDTGIWDAATTYHFICKYRNGVELHVANGGNAGIRGGTKWIGENGNWVWVDRGGFDANPKSLLAEKIGPDEHQLFRSPGHHRNFLDCVKSRQTTLAPAETAHRSASVGHLGQIAMQLGRKLHWNPDNETFAGDPAATRMLSTPMRSPWHV
ncbi:MAG: Gfo/Idh/MocA family oxidoreductase [Chthonomonadales bacterium]